MAVDTAGIFVKPLSIIVCIIIIGLFAWAFLANNGARFGVCMVSNCKKMPATDEELLRWLRSQPGVVTDSVQIFRKGQDLHVVFLFDRSLTGFPKLPDIDSHLRSLRYVGEKLRSCRLPIEFPE